MQRFQYKPDIAKSAKIVRGGNRRKGMLTALPGPPEKRSLGRKVA
jgi:hypothetical protein